MRERAFFQQKVLTFFQVEIKLSNAIRWFDEYV